MTRITFGTLALLALAACGDSNSPKGITGTYYLADVGGSPVPAEIYSEPGYSLAVVRGSITLYANGTFDDSYDLQENTGGIVRTATVPCGGSWTQNGDRLALQEYESADCGDYAAVSWDGSNTLIVTWSLLGVPETHRR